MPRLFDALGLTPDQVRAEVMATDPDPLTATGVAYWLPTKDDLEQTARSVPVVDSVSQATGRHGASDAGPAHGGSVGSAHSGSLASAAVPHGRRSSHTDVVPRGGLLRGMVRLPASMHGARTQVSTLAILAVLGVLVLAAGVFGLRVLRAKLAATPSPVAVATTKAGAGVEAGEGVVGRAAPSFDGGATSKSTQAAPSATAPASAEVVVDVVGLVRTPGVVRLAPGARVIDAIAKAGGAAAGADLAAINMARVVVDGEQIRVPRPGEAAPAGAASGAATQAGSSAATGAGGLVNLNTADLSGLDALPGVGPVLAQRILDWRTENGKFTSVDDLGEVSGIGEKLLAQIKPKATV